MRVSLVKILGGSYNSNSKTFKLRVRCIKGKPAANETLTLFNQIFSIRKITPTLIWNEYMIEAASSIEFLGNVEEMIQNIEDTEALCGLDLDQYKMLPASDKLLYIKVDSKIF